MYILVTPGEDGAFSFIRDKDVEEMLEDPTEYGVKKFLEEIPEKDPQEWGEGNAILLKYEIVKVKPTDIKYKIED